MTTLTDPPARQRPIYWFAILDIALEAGDFDAAAVAKRALQKLGITITYRCQPRPPIAAKAAKRD